MEVVLAFNAGRQPSCGSSLCHSPATATNALSGSFTMSRTGEIPTATIAHPQSITATVLLGLESWC
jgi:hypothetical protein